MKKIKLYNSAHLIVSAIRILEHQDNVSPSVENVCGMLFFSIEHGNFICNKLKEMGIVDIVDGAFGNKLYIRDFSRIETIPAEEEDTSIKDELEKYADSRKELQGRIESIKAKQDNKKKDLFAELDRQLKSKLDKKE
ncbi:MAG: hypothetical protein JRF40_01000 [Deltaproteobacteria bacterium]|nr:hypothetical protein [Deltaproteobacteria bacterium]MBW2218060.1 hypothetical protein [Deltaproteobacteria bacterium]